MNLDLRGFWELTMITRRIAVSAIGALAISPAFAQTQTPAGAANPPAANNTQPSTPPEPTHQKLTLMVGSLSLLASRLAVSRSRSAPIKQFAEFEVAEQETVADVLQSLDGKQPVDGKIRIPSDADAQRNLDDISRDALEKLRSAGAGFDQAYLKLQMDGHEQLLQAQNNYLAIGTDAARINVAKLAKSQIRDHIQLLTNLDRDNIVTGSTNARTTGQAPSALKR
jgi:putative membrane protein